jgi:prolyl oligopeptidase
LRVLYSDPLFTVQLLRRCKACSRIASATPCMYVLFISKLRCSWCVCAQVPVADMLRFHKWTVGKLWVGEYLCADASPEELEYQLKFSPLHNVPAPATAAEQLPAILITTADHDDRVVPAHSFKMTAALQATAGASPHQSRPLLVRIESNAGHGAGKPTSKVLAELADVYSFLHHELRC